MPDAVDGIATYRAHPNVVLFRTFSKAYGLAGFRVGYAVAHSPIAAALRAVSLPFLEVGHREHAVERGVHGDGDDHAVL